MKTESSLCGIAEFPELAGKGKLRVERDRLTGAWKIRLPRWSQTAAREERNSLVLRLARRYPAAALWSGADGDWTKPYAWSFPSAAQLPDLVGSLYEGAWLLFFFSENLGEPLQNPQGAPLKPKELKDMLESVSGGAAISSWYDNEEWTLVIAGCDSTEASA